MNKLLRFLLPLLIIIVAMGAARALIASRDAPERSDARPPVPVVDAVTLQPVEYRVTVRSRGVVQPRTQGDLLPQVSGTIVAMGPGFRDGGFFEPGELLLRIDPRDYQTAQRIAAAELTQARLQLAEEEARSRQAARDLARLQLDREASDLALRKPQLAGARAAVAAAEARLAQAELNLARTEIRAPYAGRVLAQNVDIGQNVTAGTVLGRIYAVDYVEVRLPLTNRQLTHVALPEEYRRATTRNQDLPRVTLHARVGGQELSWPGRIVRSEGAIDTATRQTFVIAQVDDPYAVREDGQQPLKIGQFVEADIEGRRLSDVYLVPRDALSPDGTAFAVGADGLLQMLQPEITWQDEQFAIATAGLTPGTRVVTSALPLATAGMPVQLADEAAPAPPSAHKRDAPGQ